uniref:Hexose-6-phosphate dehydrogenase/glucose 1-dehydrogenase n=1 Tax=Oncorhynchus kisutch TaxID=8019 RepID=A0A8C7IL60_ONCKI
MWKVVWATLLLLATVCAQRGYAKETKGAPKVGHVSVVIVGGTGDLAKKYLWQGFFHLYANQLSVERCALVKEQFLKLAEYWQLKTSEDYQALGKHLTEQLTQEGIVEAGRLFYLSVPAFAYADIAERINNSCRPTDGAWLRVVLEKPFGHDFSSAQLLSTQLGTSLKDEEMYRIDHYLGKQVVSKILPFRRENSKHLDPIWNKHHIERVEIVLKETLDARGRIPFYDQYGVIRDVIQNHLTEVMTLLTMGLPANLSDVKEVLRNKLKIFSALQHLDRNCATIGQYQNYNLEVQEELNKTKEYYSLTPTFAGIMVHIDIAQYEKMPIILTSGKMLDERLGYARILFKNDIFCVQSHNSVHCKPKQIVFYFGHGTLQYPAILVSKNLFKPDLMDTEWKEITEHKDVSVLGRKDSFISTENLLASWGFWTPLLHGLAKTSPRLYPGGADNGNMLDFKLLGREVTFANEAVVMIPQDHMGGSGAESFQVMQGKYRSAEMVSAWPEELIVRLAADLQASAEKAVREGGRFHLALSGGSSPLALFQRLARHHYSFPWRDTHVWMVDERCVPLTELDSNFRTLHDHLLQHVKMPYFNIHPMPVQMNQRLCVEEDSGALLYERDINQLVNASSFHFVLLGVGYDGHTASLFPGSKLDAHGDSLVALTESPAKPHQRMSLTLRAINQAQKVGVLVMGKSKHELVTQLSRVKDNPNKWPITGIRPTSGRLVWYIDYDALLG